MSQLVRCPDSIVFVGQIPFLCVLISGVPITFCSILCVCVCVCVCVSSPDAGHTHGEDVARNNKEPRLCPSQISRFSSRTSLLLRTKVGQPCFFVIVYCHCAFNQLSYMYSTLVGIYSTSLIYIHCVIGLTPA